MTHFSVSKYEPKPCKGTALVNVLQKSNGFSLLDRLEDTLLMFAVINIARLPSNDSFLSLNLNRSQDSQV